MKDIREYIRSGILESYVLGIGSPEDAKNVEEMATEYDEIRVALDELDKNLEHFAQTHTISPNPMGKPILMAIIDYTERLENGEPQTYPPILHEGSQIMEYREWLNRPDMTIPGDFEDIHARIIGATPDVMTAIVWIKHMTPWEVHDHEIEKFIIVEGTCNIIIGEELHELIPGDFLTIPLYMNHRVEVTSEFPCKAILQRVVT